MPTLWQKMLCAAVTLAFYSPLLANAESVQDQAPIKIMCGNVGRELSFCQAGEQNFRSQKWLYFFQN